MNDLRPPSPATAADATAWAGPLVGATFLAGVGGGLAPSTRPFPRPGTGADDIAGYFTQSSRAPWISVTGQLLSAAALMTWATCVMRLAGDDRLLRGSALIGGAAATAGLAASAGCAAALIRRPGRPDRVLRLHRAMFLAGGPAHGAGFGLLLAAVGLAGRRGRRLPAPLTRAALAGAVPNLLAPAVLAWRSAVWLIPAGRFPGLIVTGIAGVRLARPRPA
jgi:hypothetical protein